MNTTPTLHTLTPLYIFDLDGTLSNLAHRLHHIQTTGTPKNWSAFFSECANDAPIDAGTKTLRTLKRGGAEIWIWTGRSDEVHDETVEWLKAQGIYPTHYTLKMRPKRERCTDVELKLRWATELNDKDRQRLVCVFEDRSRMVRMWRKEGITCYQVTDGEF